MIREIFFVIVRIITFASKSQNEAVESLNHVFLEPSQISKYMKKITDKIA